MSTRVAFGPRYACLLQLRIRCAGSVEVGSDFYIVIHDHPVPRAISNSPSVPDALRIDVGVGTDFAERAGAADEYSCSTASTQTAPANTWIASNGMTEPVLLADNHGDPLTRSP